MKHTNTLFSFPLKQQFIALLACGCISFAYASNSSFNNSSIFLQSTQGIKGSGGIVTRDDGKLLTASSPQVIRVFNPATGIFEDIAYTLTDVNSLPDDLTIIPTDNSRNIVGGFAVASFLDGRIPTVLKNHTVIQANQGHFETVLETGAYHATYNPDLLGLDPIAYRKTNDKLYAAGFDPYDIYRVDYNNGGSAPIAIPLLPFVEEGRALNGFQFGPDDKLYAPDLVHGQIIQIDADSGVVTPYPATTTDTPIAVKVDSHGIIYYIGRKTGQVFKYDKTQPASANNPRVLATLEPALDNLTLNLAETKLYITNDENKIYQVDVNNGSTTILFQSPVGQIWDIAYDFDMNSIFVADFASIKRFNAKTAHLDGIIRFGDINSGLSQLGSQASSLTVEQGPNAKIIVTDITLGNIMVLNKNDFSVYDITLTSDKTGLAFKQPQSAVRVVDDSGEYYLATDTVDGKIVKIRHNGPINANNIVTEDFVTGLHAPIKLKLYKGYVYVVEMGQVTEKIPCTGRISRIPLAHPENIQLLLDHLDDPQGLDIFDGKMYFVESGINTLKRASAAHPSVPEILNDDLHLEQDVIISQFNPVAKINPPSGIAIGKKGKRLYVNETGPDAIRQFS